MTPQELQELFSNHITAGLKKSEADVIERQQEVVGNFLAVKGEQAGVVALAAMEAHAAAVRVRLNCAQLLANLPVTEEARKEFDSVVSELLADMIASYSAAISALGAVPLNTIKEANKVAAAESLRQAAHFQKLHSEAVDLVTRQFRPDAP